MAKFLMLIAAIVLIADFAVLMVYRDIVRASYLFVTTGTVLYPLAYLSLIVGILCLVAFLRSVWREPKIKA